MGQSFRRSRHPAKHRPTGSEQETVNSEPEFLLVGLITRPHGVRGEVLMKVFTDYPERLPDIPTLYLRAEHTPQYEPYRANRIRRHPKGLLIHFDGVRDRDEAEALRDLEVHISIKDAVPLEEGEYYLFQLIGIRVVTDEGKELGHLTNVLETGANDVYVVITDEGKEILLPAIPDVIRQVDIPAGVMTVYLLEGLLG